METKNPIYVDTAIHDDSRIRELAAKVYEDGQELTFGQVFLPDQKRYIMQLSLRDPEKDINAYRDQVKRVGLAIVDGKGNSVQESI